MVSILTYNLYLQQENLGLYCNAVGLRRFSVICGGFQWFAVVCSVFAAACSDLRRFAVFSRRFAVICGGLLCFCSGLRRFAVVCGGLQCFCGGLQCLCKVCIPARASADLPPIGEDVCLHWMVEGPRLRAQAGMQTLHKHCKPPKIAANWGKNTVNCRKSLQTAAYHCKPPLWPETKHFGTF